MSGTDEDAGALDGQEQQALADALAAEHAAVYAYGVVAARARADRAVAVQDAAQGHVRRRDELTSVLAAAGAAVPVSAAGYALPVAVTDATTAVALALVVEEGTAVAWRSVLERSRPGTASSVVTATSTPTPGSTSTGTAATATPDAPYAVRPAAVAALVDCASRASAWRTVLGTAPTTTAFPGTPAKG